MLFIRFRVLIGSLLLGFVISPALAQTTAVTVTVTDSSGQAWANGTIAYTFKGNGSYYGYYQWNGANLPTTYNSPTTVALDTNGTATFNLPSSSGITPGGSSWLFSVCPNATAPCQQFIVATTGSTQNLSSSIIPTAISISLPAMPLAYSDSEIRTVPAQGGLYYNTKTAVGPRQWNGTSWAALGGGGGGMVYPGVGIAYSTGSAWGSSYTAPVGTLVGTTDTQTITNKTLDGVIPATMAFVDPTSSIQNQLNSKLAQIANNTITVGAITIPANSCTSTNTLTITGANQYAGVDFTPQALVGTTAGWSSGALAFDAAVLTANTLSYRECNFSSSSQTTASTNWTVVITNKGVL